MTNVSNAAYSPGLLAQIAIRAPCERRRRSTRIDVDRSSGLERALFELLSVGMFFVSVARASTPWLARADHRLSSETERRALGLGAASILPLYAPRVPREERTMLERFGEEDRAHVGRTGRVFLRLGRGGD